MGIGVEDSIFQTAKDKVLTITHRPSLWYANTCTIELSIEWVRVCRLVYSPYCSFIILCIAFRARKWALFGMWGIMPTLRSTYHVFMRASMYNIPCTHMHACVETLLSLALSLHPSLSTHTHPPAFCFSLMGRVVGA